LWPLIGWGSSRWLLLLCCREGVEEGEHEADGYYIRSGIVVVTRNGTIPDGTVI